MSAHATSKLQDIFRAVFELPEGADVTQLRQSETPKWDSLAHVSLVAAIESEFDVSIGAEDQLEMTSYDATHGLLRDKWI